MDLEQVALKFSKIIRHVAKEANVNEEDVNIEFSHSEPRWAVKARVKGRKNGKPDLATGYSDDSLEEAAETAIQSVAAFRKIHAEDKARARRPKGE